MGVAVIVLTELGVARPMPLVLNRPALPHKTQQGLWADAQCGDEQVNMVKRLAVTPAVAHQLNNPASTHPPLSNGVNGIAGTESPAQLAAKAGLEIADRYRELPVTTKLGDDLLKQPSLVVFDRQEEVGALLGGGLKNAEEVCRASA